MQFHLNGFKAGDPTVSAPAEGALEGDDVAAAATAASPAVPEEVDVLVVGSGPAGLALAAQLSRFPDIRTSLVEQKAAPMELGQADGVGCRTVEMFQAFGFAEKLLKEAYWVNETTFWKPDGANGNAISRSDRIQDVEDGLSEFPHVVLNQARIHDFYLEVMKNSANRMEPYYSRRLVDLTVDPAGGDFPVTVQLERLDAGHEGRVETVRARYVVGCDGARSAVRKSLGRELKGDAANQAWGVMDVLAVTDFPDIRMKSLVQSAEEGSILIIPREGGYLVRIYVELDELNENERVANRNLTVDHLIAAANRILRPYTLDVKEVAWWSVYEIGHRTTDKFDDVKDGEDRLPHVFIAGDACHTHSPKAGQGMNVSMQDTFNLGWKLAAVLQGRMAPTILHTYSAERKAIAQDLIDFDSAWARMLSAPVKSPENPDGVDPAEIQKYFQKGGRYTAGVATRYKPSVLTGEGTHQHLAEGFQIGMRFHSAPVIRLADAKPMHLGHVIEADGRWRLFAFSDAGDPAAETSKIRTLCDFLENNPASPVVKYTPKGADLDAALDVRAIFQQGFRDLAIDAMPSFLKPIKGRYGLTDYEKCFSPDLKSGADIFDMRGIDRAEGALVIVRPDQYVAHVLPLDGVEELAAFFDGVLLAE
ncbi:FAD-binding monooxygenase [Rhodobium gokarnense]|uniref:Phenol 2-monooxygenase n=1 Tax=Rhodobium gokarnense TaxID=364296 RepID=A0ABT3HBX9_9HYPH|nr:FAD-binding monooxygenase [Rhodobium gokarnense]MCW2307903.1 phenol 2-monooxygenase [Rhodobium gokarnense]